MTKKILAYYSIFLGVAVITMWTIILLTQDIPEGKTELLFHLISEFIMAILCFTSGIMLIFNHKMAKAVNIMGLGMVIYSVLNASGYYGERGDLPMMLMFLILFVLTAFAIYLNLQNK